MSGTGARRPAVGLTVAATFTAGLPALIANLALELAPVRVNLIAAGFVDTRCPPRSSATSWKAGVSSSGRRCRSGGWSGRPTSPRWPSIS